MRIVSNAQFKYRLFKRWILNAQNRIFKIFQFSTSWEIVVKRGKASFGLFSSLTQFLLLLEIIIIIIIISYYLIVRIFLKFEESMKKCNINNILKFFISS